MRLLPLLLASALVSSCNQSTSPESVVEEKPIVTTEDLISLADVSVVETVTVEGMTCSNCMMHVHDGLAAMPGFVAEVIDLDSGEVSVGFSGKAPARADLAAVIEEAGYSLADEEVSAVY